MLCSNSPELAAWIWEKRLPGLDESKSEKAKHLDLKGKRINVLLRNGKTKKIKRLFQLPGRL